MNPTVSVALGLVENVSLFALVAIGYAGLRRRAHWPPRYLTLAVGVLFGFGAAIAMLDRIEVTSGVFVDGRNIMTALAAVFGGPVAGLVTVLITIACRLWLGGAGAVSGSVTAVLIGLTGLVYRDLRTRERIKLNAISLLVLGIVVVLIGSAVFTILNPAASVASVPGFALPLLLVLPLGTMLLGLGLQNEDDRLALQAKHREQTGLLETIFNSIGEGIIVADAEGRIVLANPAARKLSDFGRTAAENEAARIESARAFRLDGVTPFPAKDLPIARALNGEPTDNVQMIMPDAAGALRTISVTGRPLVSDAGGRRGGVVVFHDVGEAWRLQEMIQRNEQRFKEGVNAMQNGFALFDAEDRLLIYNEGFLNKEQEAEFGPPLGHTFEELTRAFAHGKLTAIDALLDPEGWQRWRMEVHRNPPSTPVEIQWNDGRWMRVMERRTAEGGYVGVWTDITALKMAETRLREAIESLPEGFVLLDPELKVRLFNRRMLELYPLTAPAFIVGASFSDVLRHGAKRGEYPGISSATEAEDFVQTWMRRFQGPEPYFGEGAFNDGRWVLISHRRTASGDYVSLRTDITAQKQRERELAKLLEELLEAQAETERAHAEAKRSSTLLRAIADAVPALVAHVDREQRYQYCNKEYGDIFGIDPESMVGRSVAEVVEPEIYDVVRPYIERTYAGEEVAFLRPMIANGETRYVEQRYIPSFDGDGAVDGFYAIAWDVTDSQKREQALSREALTDALTGLLNRRGMTEMLAEAVSRWREGKVEGAVLFLDIDRFKQINDTLGHDVGDELLKVFAERIRGAVRASDRVARLGGDEFVILISTPGVEEIARRVAHTLLDRVRQPVDLGAQRFAISTSIGIAVCGGRDVTPEQVLKEADLALYEAKRAGRDTYSLRHIA